MTPASPLEQFECASVMNSSVRQTIERLARQYDVRYTLDPLDALADKFAELSDSEVNLDEVQLLLVALRRAEILTSKEMTDLHIRYIRESGGR